MIKIRRADERGHANYGWLDTYHTFSFNTYYDERFMGFRSLRVINEDRVLAGQGFGTHGHRDMEIISYVLKGEIAHKDSEGNVATLPPGEFQLMSAGSGIRHSEFNPSSTNELHFLQIWIQPNVYGQTPGYQQKDFGQKPGLTLVASPDGEGGSMLIKQDARLYQLILGAGEQVDLKASAQRNYYVHVVEGELQIENEIAKPGDGVKITKVENVQLLATNNKVKALVFDLP